MAYPGTSPLPESQGGTGSSTTFTVGSIIFAALNKYSQDNANFFWDATNHYLGVGTAVPAYQIHEVQPSTGQHYIDAATNTKSTGYSALFINSKAGAAGTKSIYISSDCNSLGNTHGINVDFTTGGIASNSRCHVLEANIIGTSASAGSNVSGLAVHSPLASSATINAVSANPNVNPIQHNSGTYVNSSQSWYFNGSTYTSITTGTNTIFSNVNDYIYIGGAAAYNQISIVLSTKASGSGIAPLFQYWNGAAWTAFFPFDGTSGFTSSGVISYGTLTGWASTTVNAVAAFYIRIQRLQASLTTVPIETSIQTATTTLYSWSSAGAITANSMSLSTALPIASGGTNATSMATSSGIVKYDGTSLVTSSTALINASNFMTNTSQPLVSVYPNAGTSNVTGDATVYTLILNTATVNRGTAYNTGTGVFTAPATGYYLIVVGIGLTGLAAGNTAGICDIVTTAKTYEFQAMNYGAIRDVNNNLVLNFSAILPMTATDTMTVTTKVSGGTKVVGILGPASPVTFMQVTLLPV